MPDSGRAALYRLYDAEDRLLYVGVASDPETRWKQHARYKADLWWSEVHRKTVQWFFSRLDALHAETRAIQVELPRYNIIHRPSPLTIPDMKRPDHGVRTMGPRGYEPLYQYIADQIFEQIRLGYVEPGDRLPPMRDMATYFRTSMATMQNSVAALKNRGVLEGRTGTGIYVAPEEAWKAHIHIGDLRQTAVDLAAVLTPADVAELARLLTLPGQAVHEVRTRASRGDSHVV